MRHLKADISRFKKKLEEKKIKNLKEEMLAAHDAGIQIGEKADEVNKGKESKSAEPAKKRPIVQL